MSFSRDYIPESTLNDDQPLLDKQTRGYKTSSQTGGAQKRHGPPMATLYEQTTPFLRGAQPAHLIQPMNTPPHIEGATRPLTSLSNTVGGKPYTVTQSLSPNRPLAEQSVGRQLITPVQGAKQSPTTLTFTIDRPASPPPGRDNKNDNRVDTRTFPRLEPREPHPQQLCPSSQIHDLARAVHHHPTTSWRLEDFRTPSSSDGTSVLVSLLVDFIATTIHPHISLSQQLSVAQLATVTAPARLLQMLSSPTEANNFTDWALLPSTTLPPILERLLCPNQTPDLIQNKHTRARIHEPSLLRGDRIHILSCFIACFYPASLGTSMTELLKSLTTDELIAYNNTPGLFCQKMRLRNRRLVFAPPKWYRLSIDSRGASFTTSVATLAPSQICPSPESIDLMTITINEIRALPFPEQRTTFIAALPRLLEGLTTPAGLTEAILRVNAATAAELRSYTHLDTFIQTFLPTLEPILDSTAIGTHADDPPLYTYNLSLRHTTPSHRGAAAHWSSPPEEIYKLWIEAAYTLLAENQHRLVVIHSPFDRIQDDREIFPNRMISANSLQFYTYNVRSPRRLQNFDIWVKTTCPHLADLKFAGRMGQGSMKYISLMTESAIWVDIHTQFQEGVLPCIMLGQSIPTDPDGVISHEIIDRLKTAGISLDPDLTYTTSCIVSNSAGRAATPVKCIMTRTTDIHQIQEAFARLPLQTPNTRHLVTWAFTFTPILYPLDDKADGVLTEAIIKQQEFMANITKTNLLGFQNIDPFAFTPQYTQDSLSAEKISNNQCLAALLLLGKAVALDGSPTASPILKVSTNEGGTRIFLTAFKKDATLLLSHTADLISLMPVWMGDFPTITCAVDEARHHANAISPNIRQQKSTPLGLAFASTPSAGHAAIAAQLIPQRGIDTTQYRTIEIETANTNMDALANNHVDHTTSPVWKQDFTQLRDLIETHLLTNSYISPNSDLSRNDIISTVSTVVESSLQSSLSSMSEAARTAHSTLMQEQQLSLTAFITAQAASIQDLTKRISDGEHLTHTLTETLRKYELTSREHTAAMRDMEAQHRALRLAVESSTTCLQQMLKGPPLLTQGRQTIWPPHIENNTPDPIGLLSNTSWPMATAPPLGTSPPSSFWASLLPGHRPPRPVGKVPTLPPVSDSETRSIQKQARGILNLLETMPFTPSSNLGAGTLDSLSTTEEGEVTLSNTHLSTEQTTATTPTCGACHESGVGFLYCDRCPDPIDLFHEHCLTWIRESSERVCVSCLELQNPLQTQPEGTTLPTTPPTATTTLPPPSPDPDIHSLSGEQSTPTACGTLSSTSSSSESYSPHHIKIAFPKKSKSKLLTKLKQAKSPPKPHTAPSLRPATRSRSKPPQDAYDLNDDE